MRGNFTKVQNFIRLNNIDKIEAEIIKAVIGFAKTGEKILLDKADEQLTALINEKKDFVPISTKEETTQKEAKSALDYQVGGNHYHQMAYQPLSFIMELGLNFCEGNIVKYVARYKFKNGLQDLKKAQHYLKFLLEF